MRVRVFRGNDGKWYYESIADNNEILSVSEGHVNHVDAETAAVVDHPGITPETDWSTSE